jgi:hypothetical protein
VYPSRLETSAKVRVCVDYLHDLFMERKAEETAG